MTETYDKLAKRAIEAMDKKSKEDSLWISITGGPGAGKTTLTDAVVERIKKEGIDAVAVPMDGYHYAQKELKKRYPENGMSRRGAPWTFDAERMCRDLKIGKDIGEVSLPGYNRVISDPEPDMIPLESHHKIVIVEGNWLLLGCLKDEVGVEGSNLDTAAKDFGFPVPLSEEIQRWKPLVDLWDQKWFVVPPGGLEEQKRRLIGRSLKTWTPQKTKDWGGGTAREAATRRAENNDMKNAKIIDCCRTYADIVIDNL